MSEREPPRSYGLAARLDRLERELMRLAEELAEIRRHVWDTTGAPAPPGPAPPTSAPPEPAPPVQAPPVATPTPPRPPQEPVVVAPQPVEVVFVPPPAPPTGPPPKPPPPPRPPRRTIGELARDWDLAGPRGFAIAGGAVMALGIGFFFVLATNRGWIGPGARVVMGGVASALVFAAGVFIKGRYGPFWSALGAVAAGIAGAYATLAAAAARFDLVPDWLALPLAGVIAAVATVVAIAWSSQLIATIGLLGAALAPALQGLDREITWESVAFAVLVLVAIAVVTVPRGWRELLIAGSVLVGGQVEWLAADPSASAIAGTVAVTCVFVLTLLGIAVARQLVAATDEVDALALAYALAAFAIALIFAIQIFDERDERGATLLAAAGAWAVVAVAVHLRKQADLAFVIGASALGLGAVGTAYLLSDAALPIAWAAEALVLAVVARRLADARTRLFAIVYAALATLSALVTVGRLEFLFDDGADHLDAVLPYASAAVAAAGAGLLAPSAYRPRTESGLLAVMAEVRKWMEQHADGLREALLYAAAALATLGAAFLFLYFDFEWGHVASSAVAAVVGGAVLAVAGRIRSDWLGIAAFVWLGVVLTEALAYDGPEFESGEISTGGWSIIGAAGGLMAGSYALRVLQAQRRVLDLVCGVAVAIAAFTGAGIGIPWLADDRTATGLGWLAAACILTALTAGVFGRDGLRDFSTILWLLALAGVVGAEIALIEDSDARTVLIATTALAVGFIAGPLREERFWLAGSGLVVGTTAVAFAFQVKPWLDEADLDRDYAFVAAACALTAFALSALRWRDAEWRDLNTVVWATGIVALLSAERLAVGDWPSTIFVAALTAGVIALAAAPSGEPRLWLAGVLIASVATAAALAELTSPDNFFRSSESPGESLWVLIACVAALTVTAATVPAEWASARLTLGAAAGIVALYAASLGILEIAERVSGASVETDFERGHTAVSGFWALLGLGLLIAGLLRGSRLLRYGGLALFGLSLAKIFLYDLAELDSVARAFSFIFVGGLLLVGGFFLQRLSDRLGPPRADVEPEVEA